MTAHSGSWQGRRALAFLTLATLSIGAVLGALDTDLRTESAPLGIVSFELAGDSASAQRILEEWNEPAHVRAGISLGLDFLYLVSYGLTLALACRMLGGHLGGAALRMGGVLAWGMLAAAALDAVENVALVEVLLGSTQSGWPVLARICAIPKFAIVAAALAFLLAGASSSLWRWRTR